MPSTTELPSTHGSSPALLVDSNSNNNKNKNAVTNVEIHPLVLLSVLDHHTRRPEGAGRVIGTLLGVRRGDTVEITNCFAVPHAERGDEVAIGKDFNRQMSALHARANRRERAVGWYATALPLESEDEEENGEGEGGGENNNNNTSNDKRTVRVADTSSLVHEFYAQECEDDPVHVVLDTGLERDDVGLSAYRCVPVTVGGEPLANLFHEIRLSLRADGGERDCLDDMVRRTSDEGAEGATAQANDKEDDDASRLRESVARLADALDTVHAYVDDVVEGRETADDAVGRRIADALSAVPRVRPDVFDRAFNDGLQDLLMVTYLSNLTRTQLTIAEKLNAALTL